MSKPLDGNMPVILCEGVRQRGFMLFATGNNADDGEGYDRLLVAW